MRLLADTNIAASVVAALRAAGHDVVYAAERPEDPGDLALLTEACSERRVLITKDRDMGTLVFRDAVAHAGVVLLDDLGDPGLEGDLVFRALSARVETLLQGAFVRAEQSGLR